MSLRDRLMGRRPEPAGVPSAGNGAGTDVVSSGGFSGGFGGGNGAYPSSSVPSAPSAPARGSSLYSVRADAQQEMSAIDTLKMELHRRLIEMLDLEALEQIKDEQELTTQIRRAVFDLLRNETTPLSQAERDEIVEEVVWEITGLGPIEPLFRDPTVSDILVNGPRDIYVERRGVLSKVLASFRNDAHLLAVIDRIVSRIGRRVDEASPMVDARLPDGSRVNAIIPPLALDGAVLSIRRFGADLTVENLVERGAFTQEMVTLLAGCVRARLNILISGGTGSGKTT
ncbi:MAG: CpaF family protein, partial [Gemmatimonadaceae bacterium]